MPVEPSDPNRPRSVSPKTAAKMLDLKYEGFRKTLMRRGVFTILAPGGRGIGKRCYIPTDEIDLYGETRDELAVRQLRIERGRLTPDQPKRRRKTPA